VTDLTTNGVAYSVPTVEQTLIDTARALYENARSPNTRRAYRLAWNRFASFCDQRHLCSLPAAPSTVASHIASLIKMELSDSTITVAMAAIKGAHLEARAPDPTIDPGVAGVRAGARRERRDRLSRGKTPLTLERLLELLKTCDLSTLAGLRDRALLTVGFLGALRVSELLAVDVDHLERETDGYRLAIPFSKTDQDGRGELVALPNTPKLPSIDAMSAWLARAGIQDGPVFRPLHKTGSVRSRRMTPAAVAQMIKARCVHAGLNPGEFSPHSLRSGLLTTAANSGASIDAMKAVSRHRSTDVLIGYVRHSGLMQNHPAWDF